MIAAPLVALALAGIAAAVPAAPPQPTATNPQCSFWQGVRDRFINEIFLGVCAQDVHSMVRISFHDAIGFSLHSDKGGGADGSMIKFQDVELKFPANEGVDFIVSFLQPFADDVGISYGDAIMFGTAVGMSLCPGAPRLPAFVGRPDATRPAPDKTVPEPQDELSTIFARMADAGFSPTELVHLLASHSMASQAGVDPSPPLLGAPFDSTPFDFDSQVFLEVMLRANSFPAGGSGANLGEDMSPLPGEFRLLSDRLFARDSRTSCAWQENALNQTAMASNFAAAFKKLSLLGQDVSKLTDCSELIGTPPPAKNAQAFFPAGTSHDLIEQACATQLFPTTLSTVAGRATPIPVVQLQDCPTCPTFKRRV
ncbi:manganese-repressed peroxidase [Exidia glandulosa HHB12029]|uniref:Peroxidase n=1 Tax=Exidia glandulosa HHB12029 TaxID=1314781 RepID=A0A165FLG9_EXIGL|nr:manganese-repressed peroxidase [Exidia glandulosa HHB12029]